jgi:hypothetical protein
MKIYLLDYRDAPRIFIRDGFLICTVELSGT